MVTKSSPSSLPLRRCCRPPEHRRRRQAEGLRCFDLVAGAVRCSSAVVLVTGEFAASPATCWCPPFASSRRRSLASMRCRAAADADVIADVIVAVPRGPAVDRLISAVRFG